MVYKGQDFCSEIFVTENVRFSSLLINITCSTISLPCTMILHAGVSSKPYLTVLTLTNLG